MAFDWSQLITPAAIGGAATWMGTVLRDLLNHKSTENFQAQTLALTNVIEKGNAELKGAISGSNEALISALKNLKS